MSSVVSISVTRAERNYGRILKITFSPSFSRTYIVPLTHRAEITDSALIPKREEERKLIFKNFMQLSIFRENVDCVEKQTKKNKIPVRVFDVAHRIAWFCFFLNNKLPRKLRKHARGRFQCEFSCNNFSTLLLSRESRDDAKAQWKRRLRMSGMWTRNQDHGKAVKGGF